MKSCSIYLSTISQREHQLLLLIMIVNSIPSSLLPHLTVGNAWYHIFPAVVTQEIDCFTVHIYMCFRCVYFILFEDVFMLLFHKHIWQSLIYILYKSVASTICYICIKFPPLRTEHKDADFLHELGESPIIIRFSFSRISFDALNEKLNIFDVACNTHNALWHQLLTY